jgi:Flp pilus assembly protein TadG
LLLTLPLLLALVAALVEFSLVLAARQQLSAASREGARVAALGGDLQAVTLAAQRVLGTGSLSQAQVSAVLTDAGGLPLPSGEPVQVTVQIAAGQVAPDLLGLIGFSLRRQTLTAATVMRKE